MFYQKNSTLLFYLLGKNELRNGIYITFLNATPNSYSVGNMPYAKVNTEFCTNYLSHRFSKKETG